MCGRKIPPVSDLSHHLVTRRYLMFSNIHFKHKLCIRMACNLYHTKILLVVLVWSTETEIMSLPSELCFISQNDRVACYNEIQLDVSKRYMLVFASAARWFWKLFKVTKRFFYWYVSVKTNLHPAHCESVLCPWTLWGLRKRNCQFRKRQFNSKVCWTWAVLARLEVENRKKDKMQGRITNI
jgi:hypothetical protein